MYKPLGMALGLMAVGAFGAWGVMSTSSGCIAEEIDIETETALAVAPSAEVPTLGYYEVTATSGRAGPAFYVAAVNRTKTVCGDGAVAETCPVTLDLASSGLSPAQVVEFKDAFRKGSAVVRGWMHHDGEARVHTLSILEPWVGFGDLRSAATVYRVEPIVVRCPSQPCAQFTLRPLNFDESLLAHEVDLEASGCTDAACTNGYRALDAGDVLVAGDVEVVYSTDARAIVLRADAFFTPATMQPPDAARLVHYAISPAGDHGDGFYVAALNRASTECSDGAYADRCFVAELDLGATGLDDGQSATFLASVYKGFAIVSGSLTRGGDGRAILVVVEPRTGLPDVRLTTPVYAVTRADDCTGTNCAAYRAELLNTGAVRAVHQVALEASGCSRDRCQAGYSMLAKHGLVIAGTLGDPNAPLTPGTLEAETFFIPGVWP